MSNIQASLPNLFKMYFQKIAIAILAIALTFIAWANLLFDVNINANAATLTDLHIAATVQGVSDQVEGKVKEDIGTVQRNVGKVTGQAQGALKQAQGKAQKDIGTVKNKLDDAGDKAEDASESFVDTVKDFFN